MKKLTAEKCCQLLDSLNSNGMSILEGYYLEALEIALPILEQQERGGLVRVAFTGSGSLEAIKRGDEGFIWGSRADAHPIELFIHRRDLPCEKCHGTGEMDSGGTHPWGEQILVECDCKFEQQERGDGWIEWGGGECPVAPWEVVSVKHRNDKCTSPDGPAYQFDWSNYPSKFDTDIIAYRIIPGQPTNQNGEQ